LRLPVKTSVARIAFDERIMQEYRDILKRPDFPFQDAQIDALLSHLEEVGLRVTPMPLSIQLPNPDDLSFVKVTLSARADCMGYREQETLPGRSCTGGQYPFSRRAHGLFQSLNPLSGQPSCLSYYFS
jgi:hypothetical protein